MSLYYLSLQILSQLVGVPRSSPQGNLFKLCTNHVQCSFESKQNCLPQEIMNNTTFCSQAFSEHQRQILLVVRSSIAMTSMVTCLAAVALWMFFRLHKRFPHRLSLYLLAAALFQSFTLAMNITSLNHDYESDSHSKLCSGVGFLVQYSSWGVLLFSTEMVFHLSYLVLMQRELWSSKVELFYLFFPVLFPWLFVWIPFIHNTYGLAGAWCWIRKQDEYCNPFKEGLIEQFALWYVPYFILTIINSISITVITIILCKRTCDKKRQGHKAFQEDVCDIKCKPFQDGDNRYKDEYHQYRQALRETLPLLALPIAFLFLGWFALANRIFRAVSDQSSFPLALAHAAASPFLGFFVSTSFFIHLVLQGKFSKKNIYRSFRQWRQRALRHQGAANKVKLAVHDPTCLLSDKYTATDRSHTRISESAMDGTENQ